MAKRQRTSTWRIVLGVSALAVGAQSTIALAAPITDQAVGDPVPELRGRTPEQIVGGLVELAETYPGGLDTLLALFTTGPCAWVLDLSQAPAACAAVIADLADTDMDDDVVVIRPTLHPWCVEALIDDVVSSADECAGPSTGVGPPPPVEPPPPEDPVLPPPDLGPPPPPGEPVPPIEPIDPDPPVIPIDPVVPNPPIDPDPPVIPIDPVVPNPPIDPDPPVIPIDPVVPNPPIDPVPPPPVPPPGLPPEPPVVPPLPPPPIPPFVPPPGLPPIPPQPPVPPRPPVPPPPPPPICCPAPPPIFFPPAFPPVILPPGLPPGLPPLPPLPPQPPQPPQPPGGGPGGPPAPPPAPPPPPPAGPRVVALGDSVTSGHVGGTGPGRDVTVCDHPLTSYADNLRVQLGVPAVNVAHSGATTSAVLTASPYINPCGDVSQQARPQIADAVAALQAAPSQPGRRNVSVVTAGLSDTNLVAVLRDIIADPAAAAASPQACHEVVHGNPAADVPGVVERPGAVGRDRRQRRQHRHAARRRRRSGPRALRAVRQLRCRRPAPATDVRGRRHAGHRRTEPVDHRRRRRRSTGPGRGRRQPLPGGHRVTALRPAVGPVAQLRPGLAGLVRQRQPGARLPQPEQRGSRRHRRLRAGEPARLPRHPGRPPARLVPAGHPLPRHRDTGRLRRPLHPGVPARGAVPDVPGDRAAAVTADAARDHPRSHAPPGDRPGAHASRAAPPAQGRGRAENGPDRRPPVRR